MKTDKRLKSYLKKLGKRVKQLRLEQKLSQGQLAYESGIRREAVGFIERGEQNPTVETLLNISSALGTPMRDLFDFE